MRAADKFLDAAAWPKRWIDELRKRRLRLKIKLFKAQNNLADLEAQLRLERERSADLEVLVKTYRARLKDG